VDHDDYSDLVAKDARDHAVASLLRRRPDLNARASGHAKVPPEEQAQFELDKLAYLHGAVDRLVTDMSASVLAARRSGASWGRVGLAINESAQTTFNRYRKLEAAPTTPRTGNTGAPRGPRASANRQRRDTAAGPAADRQSS
jgi:hypothetical protein